MTAFPTGIKCLSEIVCQSIIKNTSAKTGLSYNRIFAERKEMIYFDNAATTFIKPPAVADEVYRCIRYYCGNPGRSAHRISLEASKKVFECRTEAAELFGLDDPSRVIFTMNTTMSLNMAIKGLLHCGDHVIISDMEHNAVYRPIRHLADLGLIDFDIFNSRSGSETDNGDYILNGIKKLIRPNTKLIVCMQASNICSAEMPIKEIGALCRQNKIRFAVDAAASAGHMPINIKDMCIDALCVPGHKGLYGPQGSGLLLLGESAEPDTLLEGGNGINSLEAGMSDILPERFEAGTVPTPAIAGLCEGIKAVRRAGVENIGNHEKALSKQLTEALLSVPGITVYAPKVYGANVLFNLDGIPSDDVGAALDRVGICVRSGYHCAPLAHTTLNTPDGGAVRVSFGMYNTKKEVGIFADEVRRLRREM